jgi:hypothetical protein
LKRWLLVILSFSSFLLATDNAHAMGMLVRVQQMKAQRQKMLNQGEDQQQNQDQSSSPAQPTYQQTVDARNQAIAQAILAAHNPAVSSEDVQVNSTLPDQQPLDQVIAQSNSSTVQDVADLTEVWKKLDTKSTVWTLLIDDKDKILTVSEYIDRFHKQGVKINEPPAHYAQMIDQIIVQSPQMLQKPFGDLVQIAAIVDYDFDNGMDKDTLARAVLGEEGFEANKKRFEQSAQQGNTQRQ